MIVIMKIQQWSFMLSKTTLGDVGSIAYFGDLSVPVCLEVLEFLRKFGRPSDDDDNVENLWWWWWQSSSDDDDEEEDEDEVKVQLKVKGKEIESKRKWKKVKVKERENERKWKLQGGSLNCPSPISAPKRRSQLLFQ